MSIYHLQIWEFHRLMKLQFTGNKREQVKIPPESWYLDKLSSIPAKQHKSVRFVTTLHKKADFITRRTSHTSGRRPAQLNLLSLNIRPYDLKQAQSLRLETVRVRADRRRPEPTRQRLKRSAPTSNNELPG